MLRRRGAGIRRGFKRDDAGAVLRAVVARPLPGPYVEPTAVEAKNRPHAVLQSGRPRLVKLAR